MLRIDRRKNQTLKQIKDFRIYDSFGPKSLYPYDYQFSEIFYNLMKNADLKLPGYHHLYLKISDTIENAQKTALSTKDDWYDYVISTLNFEEYKLSSEEIKEKMVYKSICQGLRYLCEVDDIDRKIIDDILICIQKKGIKGEYIICERENPEFSLTVTFTSGSMEEKNSYYLNLFQKKTGLSFKMFFSKYNNLENRYAFKEIKLMKDKIRILPSQGVRAEVFLNKKNNTIEIPYDLFKKNIE